MMLDQTPLSLHPPPPVLEFIHIYSIHSTNSSKTGVIAEYMYSDHCYGRGASIIPLFKLLNLLFKD